MISDFRRLAHKGVLFVLLLGGLLVTPVRTDPCNCGPRIQACIANCPAGDLVCQQRCQRIPCPLCPPA